MKAEEVRMSAPEIGDDEVAPVVARHHAVADSEERRVCSWRDTWTREASLLT